MIQATQYEDLHYLSYFTQTDDERCNHVCKHYFRFKKFLQSFFKSMVHLQLK